MNDSANAGRGAESNAKGVARHWPILLLINLAALSMIFASVRGQVGRFSVLPTQGDGNVNYAAVLRDHQTKRDYPLFDLAWEQDGNKFQSIGVMSPNGFCPSLTLREISK